MVKLESDIVEMEMIKIIEDVKSRMDIDAIITVNTCLNNIGITSESQEKPCTDFPREIENHANKQLKLLIKK